MIISTAMATMDEVENAVSSVREEGLGDIAVLQCTGNYPARLSNSNLNVIKTYRDKLNCIVGYSDHTPDLINPVAATAMGITSLERHITLGRAMYGSDQAASLEETGLGRMVRDVRLIETILGDGIPLILIDGSPKLGLFSKMTRPFLKTKTPPLKGNLTISLAGITPGLIIDLIKGLFIVEKSTNTLPRSSASLP